MFVFPDDANRDIILNLIKAFFENGYGSFRTLASRARRCDCDRLSNLPMHHKRGDRPCRCLLCKPHKAIVQGT